MSTYHKRQTNMFLLYLEMTSANKIYDIFGVDLYYSFILSHPNTIQEFQISEFDVI